MLGFHFHKNVVFHRTCLYVCVFVFFFFVAKMNCYCSSVYNKGSNLNKSAKYEHGFIAKLTIKKGFRAGEMFYLCPQWPTSNYLYFILYMYEISDYGLMNICNCRIPIANFFFCVKVMWFPKKIKLEHWIG